VEKVRLRYRSIAKQWHQTDNDELLQTYLSAVTAGFDPHSSYMSASSLENFQLQMRLELDGIGASLRYVDGYTVVHRIIPGGAADKDGRLKPEDKVVSVGQGTEGEMVDVVDMKLTDVVQLIRGTRGTIVRLGVIPSDSDQVQVYDITRARIELTDSAAKGEVMEVGALPDGSSVRVGVLVLPSFYMDMEGASRGLSDFKSATRDVKRLLEEFRQNDVDAVVLDLRGNGGGSLTEAINLTGLFIDDGPVVQVKGYDGRVQPYEDSEPGMTWSGPLVVVIDKFSASASEIFAGAIQDYGRGVVVGDRTTHGKGTVQQLFDLGRMMVRVPPNSRLEPPNWGALKITIQQFYRPSGDSTQNRGVVSDVELPSLTTHWDVGEADLDYALAFDQVKSVPHTRYELVDPGLMQQLKGLSEQRIQQSEDFKKLQANINRYLERKERKKVTLNEAKFLAERAEFDEETEEEKHFDELSDPGQNGVERDYYLDEVLSITSDYVQTLERNKVARRG
jgi:carboxyl-terminal processing protease